MKGIGQQLSVGFAKEAVRGTAEAAASLWVPFIDVTLDEKDTKVIDEAAIGVMEEGTNEVIIKQWADLQLKSTADDTILPLLLLSTLGSISSAVKETTAYNHTITVGQSAQHQSLTGFIKDPLAGADYKHANMMVETLEIDYQMGKFINYTLKMKGKKGVTATNTAAITAVNRFSSKHVIFKLAANQAGLGAAPAINVRSLKLKINNSVEDDDILGALSPADFLNKRLTIEGDVEAIWQNESDFKTFALAGTQKAMRIDLQNTDVVIGATSNPGIQIDLYKVIFGAPTRPIKINDVVRQTLTFKAHYSIADSKSIQVVCTNTKTSY